MPVLCTRPGRAWFCLKLVFLAAFALPACVSSSTHEKLQQDYDSMGQENARLKTELATAGVRIDSLDKNLATTAKENGNMAKALEQLRKSQAEADKRLSEFRQLTEKFKSLIDSKTLLVKIDKGRMVVAMATDILFPSGSAKLSKEGKAAVANVGALLATITDREFQIEGHTDNVKVGNNAKFSSNWDLAAARAINVLEVLEDSGVPANHLSAAGFSDTRPVQSNETSEGRAANRRIEIAIVPDLSTLPGFEELSRMSGGGATKN